MPTAALADTMVRTPAQASYTVRLRAGATGHTWTGHEDVTFTNVDSIPLGPRIWLRVWSNGVMGCAHQAIFVTDVTGGTAGPLRVKCTALPVTLAAPLGPGDSATIGMDLRIEVPAINDRFGYHGGLTLLGTALPTLAIHDDAGWHLDPFIDLGESFYSIVGSYDVALTVPAGMDTPATGVQTSSARAGTHVTRTYEATDVRDFEWGAAALRQRSRIDADGTTVRVWFLPGTAEAKISAMLDIAVASMEEYSADLGTYPYPEVDVVLTAFTSFGGMDYPQLVFTNPHAGTVAHELAHQWFYGIVGDDQYHAPWLDESFATYLQTLPTGENFCPKGVPSWPSSAARVTNDMAYWADHPGEYYVVYYQGSCMLQALAHKFGRGRFLQILHDYAAAHWLGISTTADFTAAVEAAAATDFPSWDVSRFWSHWRLDPAA